jgi:aromatic-L-amino-acid/L-tryptophan decarboxylase
VARSRSHDAHALLPDADARGRAQRRLVELIERHWEEVGDLRVTPDTTYEEVAARLAEFDFREPVPPERAIEVCGELLRGGIVHTSHPRYFGLFNPTPTFAGVCADALVAAFNPQLAVASHAPVAVAIERHVLSFLSRNLGLADAAGSFTSGGAEANLTAVLVALERHFPEAAVDGLEAVRGRPTLYVSSEAHHSLIKVARMTGLGHRALRLVPATPELRLDPEPLRGQVVDDRAAGDRPFLVVATAGTTAAGVVDPLGEIADLCDDLGLDLHVDAAWGGAVCLSDRLRPILAGIERADSVTIDAHKWLSVPMGAGVFLTPHREALESTFRVTADYMPSAAGSDPYLSSVQWSRRFIGLKLFMSLIVAGRAGYAAQLEHDCRLADRLRALLEEDGWLILNRTPLPVACFTDDPDRDPDRSASRLSAIAAHVESSGAAWISVVTLAGRPALRACITSYRSSEDDVMALRDALGRARAASGAARGASPAKGGEASG